MTRCSLRIAWCVGLLVMLGFASAAHAAPSFSCASATAPIDRAICADAGLSAMDVELAEAFRNAEEDVPNEAAKASLLREQRQWLAARVAACPGIATGQAVDCLERIYEQRVAVLSRARNAAAWPHLPFRPTLVEGVGNPLCNALLTDITATFVSPAMIPNPLGVREIGFVSLQRPQDGQSLLRADFDPYNSGKPVPVLLQILDDGGLHLGTTQYRRFPSATAVEAAISKLRSTPDTPLSELGVPVFDVDTMRDNSGNRIAKPLASFMTDDTVYVPVMPRFFAVDGKVYVYAPLGEPDSASLTGVYQMVNPRLPRRICLFKAGPEQDLQRYETLTKQAGLPALESAVAPLLPNGMVCWAVGDDVRTRDDRALWRPWSLEAWPHLPGNNETEKLRRYLANRALTGLERHLQYREYLVARDNVIAGYAAYYRSEFARTDDTARALATQWLDQGLYDDAEFDSDDGQTKAMFDPSYAETHKPEAAALAGDTSAMLAALGNDPKSANRPRGAYDEPLPTYALEHPATLRSLLDLGFDPNAFGASGRTALMTTARLDLVEAAVLLLDHGAQADLGAGDDVAHSYSEGDALCMRAGQPPEGDTPGRTALSYAAELASPAMVRLLLAHGASAEADSEGKEPADWAATRKDAEADEVRRLLAPAR